MSSLNTSNSNSNRDFFTGIISGSAFTACGLLWWNLWNQTGPQGEDSEEDGDGDRDQAPRSRGLFLVPSRRAHRDVTISNPSLMTRIVEELWAHIRIAGAAAIRGAVEPLFADLPAPLNTCRFTKLDLGDVPIRLDNDLIHKFKDGNGETNMIKCDIDLVWDGKCDIQLKADYIGKFGVRHLKVSGRLSLLFKPLMNELPVISAIQFGFLNPPTIDFDFTGLASIAEFKILKTTILSAIQSGLSCLVLPSRQLFKLTPTTSFLDAYQPPVGVVRLTVQKGHGFVVEKRTMGKNDIPDVYLNINLAAGSPTWRTKTIQNNLNPEWNETGDFCLFDTEQLLMVHACDEDSGLVDSDDDLGSAKISVDELLKAPDKTSELSLSIYNNKSKRNLETGAYIRVLCDFCQWTPNLQSLSQNVSNQTNNAPVVCGLLVIIVHRAFDLPLDQKERKTSSTFVKVTYNGKEYDSNVVADDVPGYDVINPVYDSGFSIPIYPDMPRDDNAEVTLDLIHINKDKSNVLGSIAVTFGSLKKLFNSTLTERRMIGNGGASLEFRVSLSGVGDVQDTNFGKNEAENSATAAAISTTTTTSTTTTKEEPSPTIESPLSTEVELSPPSDNAAVDDTSLAPVGVLRLNIKKGRGFVVEKRRLRKDDIPDVYLNITLGDEGSRTWRTKTIQNNVNPEWNETVDFCLMDQDDPLLVHAWDEDKGRASTDDDLGSAMVSANELLRAPERTLELPLCRYSKKEKKNIQTGAFITVSSALCEWTTDLQSLSKAIRSGNTSIICGLLAIVVNRATGLKLEKPKNRIFKKKKTSILVKVLFAGKEYDSKMISGEDAVNPVFDFSCIIPITQDMPRGDTAQVKLDLIQVTGRNNNGVVLGSTLVSFERLKKLPNNTLNEQRTIGTGGASLEFRVSLNGVREVEG